MNKFCHYSVIPKKPVPGHRSEGGLPFWEKIMRNNKLKRNGGSTPFHLIAANGNGLN